MTAQQEQNVKDLVNSFNKFGITNKNLQAGILATISKESRFIPQSENLNYSYENIKRVWPKTPDDVAKSLAKNPEKLGNFKYGGRYGNAANEGYKYRGRGYNQITFKGNYDKFGKMIGQDLVNNPDLLNDPKIAADAAAAFFSEELKNGQKSGSFKKFGVDTIDAINDTTTATKVAIQINAGRGTSFDTAIVQEGYKKASGEVDSLFQKIANVASEATTATVEEVKKKPILTITITAVVVVSLYLLITNLKSSSK